MAIQSREFIGIAEGIKSHELSAKGKIESLKGTISKLSGVKSSLNSQISSLEASLAAAYEDTDDDGNPDYNRISAIESRISSAESQLYAVEGQLDGATSELEQTESELDSVMEEKARTLFEIQERARKTSKNISVSGGMYGAYAGVGSSLQSSMQASLSSLSQAAAILDGTVENGSSGGGGNSTGGRGASSSGELSTSALSAFVADSSSEILSGNVSPSASTPSTFTTSHSGGMTPATSTSFQPGQRSINPQKTLNFKTEQVGNSYATSSFLANDGSDSTTKQSSKLSDYQSSQSSSSMEKSFSSQETTMDSSKDVKLRGDLEKRRAWAQQYKVGFTPVASSTHPNSSSSLSSAPKKGQRELADELDYELSIGSLLSKFGKGKASVSPSASTTIQSSTEKRIEFLQRLHADVKPVPNMSNQSSNSSDNSDDSPSIGARIRQRNEHHSDRERELSSVQRDVDNIKNKFASFLQKESSTNKSTSKDVTHAQRIIDNYCKKSLKNILSESKQSIRLTDSVEFQDEEKFAMGLGGYERAAGVNGYNDGKKSYVKNSGPHPQKTAIHEHNHQLSCNDVKDKFGYITEYRRGISINGRDRQVNEALTEYFTKKMMGLEYPANPNVGYKDNMLRVEKMESGFGEQILKEAYYQNKPQLLKSRYESVMGEGTWATFSRAFDESLRKYTPQEIQAIREHYRNTGTRLTTQTDIIRKEAIDYANRCATLFAIKSKGVK